MARWGFSIIGALRSIRMMRGVKIDVDGTIHWRVEAGKGTRYAIYVEHGTSITPSQPYMVPAYYSAIRNSDRFLAEADGDYEEFARLLAEHMHDVAREEVPVDTGKLKDSITIERLD